MAYVVQERARDSRHWETMLLNGEDCEMALANAEQAASKLRGYFGVEFEYRVIEKQDACEGKATR